MRSIIKTLLVTATGLVFVVAVACGGGGGDSASNGDQPDAAVLDASEALIRSADGFQEDVDSLQGEMSMEMSFGGVAFGLNGRFAFKSPDQMYMKMEFSGDEGEFFNLRELGDIEMLLLGDEMYLNMPFFGGWVVMSLDELGVDAQQYRDLLESGSPVDYGSLIEGLGSSVEVSDLGEEDVAGHHTRHYRLESDFASLIEAFGGTLGDDFTSDLLPVGALDGPVVTELWLDTETLLPYKVTASGSFEMNQLSSGYGSDEMTFEMTIVIIQYNGFVKLPEPPKDAKSLDELGEDMFGGFEE
jgi:outer membrane lipoprotein-sorting protein